MNFNVDEKLFAITSIWEDLTNSQHRAMIIVLNQIVHWSRVSKHCELREGNIERLYRIPRRDIVMVRKRLLELEYIKCHRQYCRKNSLPAIYSCTTGLWSMIQKPVVSQTMDNNYNNNYRGEGVFSDTSPKTQENVEDLNLAFDKLFNK